MRRDVLGILLLWAAGLSGCGGYASFTLPAPGGTGDGRSYTFEPRSRAVLEPGSDWEAGDVLNPSVVRTGRAEAPWVNLYSGFDGRTWSTGLAESSDGITWRKAGKVLGPEASTWEGSYIAANGAALLHGGELWYWYQSGPKGAAQIGLARSRDGRVWRREAQPVLAHGPYASWDERAVADPDVIWIEPYFYLYYLGQDRAARQRLGVARSRDGLHWEKLRANPVLDLGTAGAFDENGLGEPAVWAARGAYWMLYTGRDAGEMRRLGMARSTDGVHWSKLASVFAGAEAWDARTVCDPSVWVEGETVHVWFGGGDTASPDENLHGRIGYGRLVLR
jgi:predicted GH43/DUF377 family glycosyl hydrolase